MKAIYLKELARLGKEVGIKLGLGTRDEGFLKLSTMDTLSLGVDNMNRKVQQKVAKLVQEGLYAQRTEEEIRNKIQEVLDFTQSRADLIARTEMGRFQNAARVAGYRQVEQHQEGKYKLLNPGDRRTCDACLAVLEAQGKGQGLEDLLDTMAHYSKKHYPSFTFDRGAPVMHYNSRSKLVRVVL